jgi:hypothetical protein
MGPLAGTHALEFGNFWPLIEFLNPPSALVLAQTFDMVFAQYSQHPESKSFGPDGTSYDGDTRGLLQRCPVTASAFRLIGKETERGWEQGDDISTLLPSLVQYDHGRTDGAKLQQRLRDIPLDVLQAITGLSRHTLVRARRGQRIRSTSSRALFKAFF